ncbi:MAG: ABC transporter ATP-binding protein [Thermoflexales bacterium]|nr:ABC transporter ATP-binding protein [Thermoflexales bacterium]
MTANPASLSFEHISFAYSQGRPVVRDVCLSVRPGEIVVLVGPSGCGKSTLLRLVAGLLFPTEGRLLIDDADTGTLPPEKRQVGWVPQSYALFEHLSVRDNIAFGLRMRGAAKREIAQRVGEMLELCRITELADRHVRQLSGGQRQRVAIARALAVSPRVLLLDEPLAALDPQLRTAIRADLEALLRASGVTTLFVTHDQAEAMAVADRVAVLREGRVEQFGTPQMLWRSPANAFVAEFFGGATVLPAERISEFYVRIAPGLEAPTASPVHTARCQVALRQSDLEIVPQNGTAESLAQFTVKGSEFSGDAFKVTGEVAGAGVVTLLHDQPVVTGQTYPVRIRAGRALSVVGE